MHKPQIDLQGGQKVIKPLPNFKMY